MPITISKLEKYIVRIGTVQINYELTDEFPPKLVNEEKTKEKIICALKKADDLNTNIICLPELCICDEWLSEIKKQFRNMIIISGSCYDERNRNVCRILTQEKEEIPPQIKITPSIFEEPELTGKGMLSGAKLFHVYETRFGRFSILICRDFINFCPQTAGEGLDIIFVPSYNPALDRFHECASNQIENHEMYIIISNTAIYGGTSIFGLIHKDHFKRLIQEKCKDKNDKTYKLCEIKPKAEGIIIADFNLRYKSVVRPTPANASDEKKTVTNIKRVNLE
jgi:predicted amidohydrolase